MNMKKYMILAAVALVASAACTKVEDTTPARKISFEVANYVAQTKAEQATNAELGGSFTTNAWFTNGDGDKTQFMNNETISWNTPVSGQWAPSREYFWPKTGYIDFYSYDGVPAPSTKAEGSLVYDATSTAIAATDNILVADAAFHQTENGTLYQIDGTSVKGVPTLFRHMLAKIHFTVKVATTDAKKTPNTKWTVTILNETGKESNIVVNNKGTLTLTNTYAGSTPATQPWTNANNSNHNVGWVASATETLDFLTPAALVMAKNTISSGDPVDLLALRSIMPQVLGNEAVFTLHYNVKATFVDPNDGSETTYLDENREISLKINTIKNASSIAITEWDMNQIITYNVIIDPVGEQILFDPAVEEWDKTQTGTINVPQA
jgi:hypothetical protein